MIQDIGVDRVDIHYTERTPAKTDYVLRFNSEGDVLVASEAGWIISPAVEGEGGVSAASEAGRLSFPTADGLTDGDEVTYLFSVGDTPYFLLISDDGAEEEGFTYQNLRKLRGTCQNVDLFIAFTAYHLWRWYMDNRVCGRCGHRLVLKKDERALVCNECGNIIYPRINPAVIVGVIKGDTILITRYRTGYKHNALVAGFAEIGETLEQTVEREVMEETGIKVKKIRYYKSQPWGIAQDVLVGFFCEADGDCEIRMDEDELKYAAWVSRDELELQPSDVSLTNEMMKVFKEGNSVISGN